MELAESSLADEETEAQSLSARAKDLSLNLISATFMLRKVTYLSEPQCLHLEDARTTTYLRLV